MHTEDKQKLQRSIYYPLYFLLALWLIQVFTVSQQLDLVRFGVLPRTLSGLIGIITAPFIHGDYSHLFSNTIPLLILGFSILYFYPVSSYRVILLVYALTGIFVWLFAREASHIGASGLIYGFVAFLFFSGIIRRDNKSIGLALIVTFLYGSLIWGVLPGVKDVSWESHLFGGISGIIAAIVFRKTDPVKKYDWEEEDDDDDDDHGPLEISYDADKNEF